MRSMPATVPAAALALRPRALLGIAALVAAAAAPAGAGTSRPPADKRAAAAAAADLGAREVLFRGQRTCEIRGRGAALDLVQIQPPGAPPFRLAVANVPATVHLAPPDDARAMHHVTVAAALAFEGLAPGEWGHFVTARAVAPAGGLVRLGRGVRLNEVRGAAGGALATVDLEHAVKLEGLLIPCAALALDEPAGADALEPPREPTDGTSWVAKGTRITLRGRPQATAPGYPVQVEYASALVMSRVREEGRFLLLDSWQERSPVAVSGWIDQDEVEGYLPTMRTSPPPVGPQSPTLDGPPPLERGVYEGPAVIAAGTPIHARPDGASAWATVRDDRPLRVRWKTDEAWVQIVSAPGIGGLPGHAFLERRAVSLPLLPGSWRFTAAPPTARLGHTATRLRDGRVLVVGGWGPTADDPLRRVPLASAEVFQYAPGGGNEWWSGPFPIGTGRAGHTATLLDDGRVLIAGGEWLAPKNEGIALASAELFDPVTLKVTPTSSPMVEARIGHTATLLDDGTVLLAGGDNGHGRSLEGAELFDPRDGRFHATTSLATRRYDHSATRLPSGKVMIVGGRHKNYALRDWWTTFALETIEVYDPATRLFSTLGELPAGGRTRHSATLLPGGRVLVAGGARETDLDLAGIARSALLYEPEGGSWMLAGDTTAREEEARGEHAAVPLPDGRVVIVSGPYTLLFDPAARRWESLAAPGFERAGHTATLLGDGRILVVGGEPVDDNPVRYRPGAELFAPPAPPAASAPARK